MEKAVVITGASGGIGAALARDLGSRDTGWRWPSPPTSPAARRSSAAIAELIECPRAEIFTNPAQVPIARRYYEDIAAFEEQMAAPSSR